MLVSALTLLFTTQVRAATLSVETIGGISVGTVVPTSWTHTGINPVIAGSASPSASVQVSIDSAPYTVVANSLGDWSYVPTTLTSNRAYEIVVTSGIENLIFTLNLSGASTTTSTTSAATSTSSSQPTLPVALPSSGSSGALVFGVIGFLLIGVGAVSYAKLPQYMEEEL